MRLTWQETLRPAAADARFVAGAAVFLGLLAAAGVLLSQAAWQPLAALAALGLLWLALARPEVGLAMLVFVVYTRAGDVLEKFHGVPSFVLPLALLLLAALAWRWWFGGERVHDWEETAVLFGVYALVGFSSLLYAADPGRTQVALYALAKNGVLLFVVFLAVRHRRALRHTVWALIAAGIFMGTLTVYQQLTGTLENPYWGFAQTEVKNIVGSVFDYRVAGPVGSTNYYAMILVMLVPVALDRAWHERRRGLRLAALWALGVCVLSVVFTFSRGGFVALVVVLLLMLARELFSPRRLLIGGLLLVVVWQFLPANYTGRLATTLDLLPGGDGDARSEVSFRGRTSEVLVAWQIFVDHPLLGAGLNNYKTFYQAYAQPLGWDNRREERSAHNLFLETAAETGLLGLAAFGALLVAAWRGAGRARRQFMRRGRYDEAEMSRALAVGLVGFLVASLFLHGSYLRYFWLWLGVLLALPHVAALAAPRPAAAVEADGHVD